MQVDILRAVTDWLIADLPQRIASAPADLGEPAPPAIGTYTDPQIQNLLFPSTQIDQWTRSGESVTTNSLVAPDGTATGDVVVPTTGTIPHLVSKSATVVASQAATASVFVQAQGYSKFRLALSDSPVSPGNAFWADVTLINGGPSIVATGTSGAGATVTGATITARPNGWFRVELLGVAPAATMSLQVWTEDANGNTTFAGDGVSGLGIWGGQITTAVLPMPPYMSTTTGPAGGWPAIFEETRYEYAANFKEPPVYPALYVYCRAPVAFDGEPTPDRFVRKSKSPVPVVILYMAENSTKQDAIRDGERTLRAIQRSLFELSKGVNEMARIRNGIEIVLGEGPTITDPIVAAVGKSKSSGAVGVGYYVRDLRPNY